MQAHCGMQSVYNKCREVMKCHNHRVEHLSDQELTCMLNNGVTVGGNKKFWLDAKHHMCAQLFAKALDISHGSNCHNWTFKREKMSCGESVEVAELKEVCRLEVKGHFNAKMLTPNIEYEVIFDIQVKSCAEGFGCHPVKFTLTNSGGCKTETNKSLDQLKGKGYTHISIGKFRSPSECACETNIEFKMQELNCQVKKGLIVRGVIIRPTAKCGC